MIIWNKAMQMAECGKPPRKHIRKRERPPVHYFVICETYIPALMQFKEALEKELRLNGILDYGFIAAKKPESICHVAEQLKEEDCVPYIILLDAIQTRRRTLCAVRMLREHFGLSHVVIAFEEGNEIRPGRYAMGGALGVRQPVTLVPREELMGLLCELLADRTWPDTVRRTNERVREQREQRKQALTTLLTDAAAQREAADTRRGARCAFAEQR